MCVNCQNGKQVVKNVNLSKKLMLSKYQPQKNVKVVNLINNKRGREKIKRKSKIASAEN